MKAPISVLDHGHVRYITHAGTDDDCLEAARMSTGNPTGVDPAADERTRDFLWRHGHSSPFEMGWLHLELQLPIFVARQIMRHRLFSFNEFSARYSEMPDLYYLPDVDRICAQDAHNKQASGKPLSESQAQLAFEAIDRSTQADQATYEFLLNLGVARETARGVKSVNQYTKIRMAGNLRVWLDFLSKRLPENAQWETRQYAEAITAIVKDLWPKTYALFEEYTLSGIELGATEVQIIRMNLSAESEADIRKAAEQWLPPGRCREFLEKLGLTDR